MRKVVSGSLEEHVQARAAARAERPKRRRHTGRGNGQGNANVDPKLDREAVRQRRADLIDGIEVPSPPFWHPGGGKGARPCIVALFE